jgi:hypothetical protein
MLMTRSGSVNGSGRSSSVFTGVNTVTFAAMPSDRHRIATSAYPGDRRSDLTAKRTVVLMESIRHIGV